MGNHVHQIQQCDDVDDDDDDDDDDWTFLAPKNFIFCMLVA